MVGTVDEPRPQAFDVGHYLLGRQAEHPVGRAEHVGEPGLERPEVDAVGLRQQLVERQRARPLPNPSP